MAPAKHNRPAYITALALLSLTCLACPPDGTIWLEDGATTDRLVFHLTYGSRGSEEPLNISHFYVIPTGPSNGRVWSVKSEALHRLSRVEYGVVPPGFTETHPAEPLGPGCYKVAAGSTFIAFRVQKDGGVRAWGC